MKTVLLPTDFSRNAWNALFTILKLYHRESCTFILLHAYQPAADGLFSEVSSKQLWEVYEDLKAKAEVQMSEVTTYLKNEHHNTRHSFRSICVQGDLLAVVRNQLQQEPVDLTGSDGSSSKKATSSSAQTKAPSLQRLALSSRSFYRPGRQNVSMIASSPPFHVRFHIHIWCIRCIRCFFVHYQ